MRPAKTFIMTLVLVATIFAPMAGNIAAQGALYEVSITCNGCDGSVETDTDDGSTHSYEATVTNEGLRADGFRIVALNDKEWVEVVTPESLSLLPGQSGTVNVTIQVPGNVPDGTRSVTNVIVQSTSTGCSNCANVDVTTTVHSPSLIVQDIKFDNAPQKDQETTIIVTVRNDGSINAKKASVEIVIDGDTLGREHEVGEVPASGTTTIEVPWTPGPGTHEVSARISSSYRSRNDQVGTIEADAGGNLALDRAFPIMVFMALLIIVSFVIVAWKRKGQKGHIKKD